jgi:hypothetical protein
LAGRRQQPDFDRELVTAKNNNGKPDPCLNWFANMHDHADTVGFSLTKKALLSPRFDFIGDIVYSRAQTDVDVRGGSYSNSPFALAGAPVLPAGVPAISELADTLSDYHVWLAWGLLVLVGMHVAAAAWHHFVRRDAVLRAMLPSPRKLGGRIARGQY